MNGIDDKRISGVLCKIHSLKQQGTEESLQVHVVFLLLPASVRFMAW